MTFCRNVEIVASYNVIGDKSKAVTLIMTMYDEEGMFGNTHDLD
jgi:hypothetical protein